MLDKKSVIFVAGHKGLVGSAVIRSLLAAGYQNIHTQEKDQLNLANQYHVIHYFNVIRPQFVVLAAAKVGGIMANSKQSADFLYENLMIQSNVLMASHLNKVERLIFLGSSCIYPKHSPNPIMESALLSGYLEPTNEAYAVAKIAGVKLCQALKKQHGDDFLSLMPTNLYGPNDNYNPEQSHVIPGLIKRIHTAKKNGDEAVKIWGSGLAKREFMHSDDLADVILMVLKNGMPHDLLNVGSGEEVTIAELAQNIADIVGYKGKLLFDSTMPEGTPQKLLDSSRLRSMGWKPKIDLMTGLNQVYTHALKKGTL